MAKLVTTEGGSMLGYTVVGDDWLSGDYPFREIKELWYLYNEVDPSQLPTVLACCFFRRMLDNEAWFMPPEGAPRAEGAVLVSSDAFRVFLGMARNIPGLLPPWTPSDDALIGELHKAYGAGLWNGDEAVVSELRCLGEVIYGCSLYDEPLLDHMVAVENGTSTGKFKTATPKDTQANVTTVKQPKETKAATLQDSQPEFAAIKQAQTAASQNGHDKVARVKKAKIATPKFSRAASKRLERIAVVQCVLLALVVILMLYMLFCEQTNTDLK